MTLQEFLNLSDEEQEAAFVDLDAFNDLTAERDSLRDENTQLRQEAQTARENEQKTKTVNYTLARRLNLENDKKDPEELLHDMFKRS